MDEEDEGDSAAGSRGSMRIKSDGASSDSDDSGSFESLSSPRHYEDACDRNLLTSGEGSTTFTNGNSLREKVMDLVEKCDRLERQRQAAVDLLADKKRHLEEAKERYEEKIKAAEAQVQRLSYENKRLLGQLNLSPEERESMASSEKEITEMKERVEEAESRCAEALRENHELRHELRESRLEMEELHDQFREDEALEFRELQKELESTAKNCRILQFKLRKMEKRCEQLELDKRLEEERHRFQASGVARMEDLNQGSEEGQLALLRRRVCEFEEELRVAKEVSVKLHDQMEMAEEKRMSYEHELERVSAMLGEAEVEKLSLRGELEQLREEQGKKGSSTLHPPQFGSEKQQHSPTIAKTPSPSVDLQLIMRDLNDSLEREHDLREQLKFSEEEIIVMRKKMAEMEEELESVNHQLSKLAAAKQVTAAPRAGSSAEAAEREQELKLQIELSESEAKVLRRRLDEMDSSYEVLLNEVKQMRSKVTSFGVADSSTDAVSGGFALSRSMTFKDSNHEIMNLARDIDKLKIKLIERDQYADRSSKKKPQAGQEQQVHGFMPGTSQMVKSKSLEDDNVDLGSINVSGRIGRLKKMARVREEEEESRVYLDARIQAEILEQEALLLRSKVKSLEQEVTTLRQENDGFKRKGSPASLTQHRPTASPVPLSFVEGLQSDNAMLRLTVQDLEEKVNRFNKEILKMKFRTVDLSREHPDDWNEIKKQVIIFEEGNRKCQRRIVDLEAECLTLKTKLDKWETNSSLETSTRKEELDKNSKDFLKERIIELEGELKGITRVLTQREEENEQLENEISEGREDLGRLVDAFKRREDLLSEELDDLKKKNSVVSDLLKLVTERAESTQKELEDLRGRNESGTPATGGTSTNAHKVDQPDLDALRKQIQILQKMLKEERCRSEAAELRIKMADDPTVAEKKLKQHEKDITKQELSLCQKQLKAANDQICCLKERLSTLKETHDHVKDDLARVTEELKETKEQKENSTKVDSTPTSAPASSTVISVPVAVATTSEPTSPVAPPRLKEPASWRWEKQEMERQLKELRKKLDDSHVEMKRYQVRWKAAGEDIERESQIRAELGKKIEKLNEENKNLKLKLDELSESSRKCEKHLEMELKMAIKEREDAEKEVKELSEMVASKEDIIQQKNRLIADKERSTKDKEKALRETTEANIVAEVSLRTAQSELAASREQVKQLESEVCSCRQQLVEKEQQLKQLDEQLRRRDDRLKEKDDFLQQINRKLTEKGNQVSDMDKTIRQIIRKLQARDCDLSMTNAELRRIQTEFRALQEKYQEAKAAADAWETKAKLGNSRPDKGAVTSSTLKSEKEHRDVGEEGEELKQMEEEKKRIETNLSELKEIFKNFKEEAERQCSELEEKVKLAEERAHASDLLLTAANQKLQSLSSSDDSGANFTPSDAYKQMMREKETLISEKFKLNEELNRTRRQLESAQIELEKNSASRSRQVHAASSNFSAVVGMTGSPTSVKKQRPESLSLSFSQATGTAPKIEATISSPASSSSLSAAAPDIRDLPSEAVQVIAGLKARLGQQELHWRAEKATLEEYYDAQAHQLREVVKHLQDKNQRLRSECDSQMLVLQNSKRALSDLRHRFDLTSIAWNEERDALRCKVERFEELKVQVKTLDKATVEMTSTLSTTEAKKSEIENRLSMESAMWKIEKEGLEEKIKALQSALATQGASHDSASSSNTTNTTKSTPFTRVSEFKARFEKFSRMGKKFEDHPDRTSKRSSDAVTAASGNSVRLLEELVKNLQGQIAQLEGRRMSDENAWRKRLNDLNHNYETDLMELRKKLATFEKKDKEYSRQQRILSELQFRFVDDACQWQKQRDQLEQQVEETRKELIQQKESVGRLVAEVKRLKVLTSSFGPTASGSQSSADTKTRSRSLTPSAEKLRILALNNKERIGDAANTSQLVLQDILQAVEEASRLAEDINRAGPPSPHLGGFNSSTMTFGGRKNMGLSGSFKRSSSTAEVISSTSSDLKRVTHRPSKRELRKSSSQEADTSLDAPTNVTISVSDSKSNRNSMYTSGTQSAYASRDHSPDTKFLPTLTLPRGNATKSLRNSSNAILSTSPYPKAPPSMIITPTHTPNREQSTERATGNEVDVSVVYRKLEAILASEDSDKNFNRRVAVVSGVDDHYKRNTGERQLFGLPETSTGDISFVPPADSPSVAGVGDRFSFASKTLPATRTKHFNSSSSAGTATDVIPPSTSSSSSSSAATSSDPSSRGGRNESRQTTGSKQRSASVSPRTARKQFFENYEKFSAKPQQISPVRHQQQQHLQHQQQQQQKKYMFSDYTAEHRQPGDVLGIEPGFAPLPRNVSTTSSSLGVNSSSRLTTSTSIINQAPPTSTSSVGKKFLKIFSSKDFSSSEQEPLSSGKGGFFQSVKERRKLFGGKKANSVDSPIGVSIARIGANILSEPAAPSNYQPPHLPPISLPLSQSTTSVATTPTSSLLPSADKGEKRK